MDYTYYVDEDGKVFRLHVETDDEPWNPREDMDGNIGTMFCMHGRYKLGDKTSFSDSIGMKYAMLQDAGITTEKVIKLAKEGKKRSISGWFTTATKKCGNSWSGIVMVTKDLCHTNTILSIWKKMSSQPLVCRRSWKFQREI